jgi:flagellar assembly factor FliW
MPGTMQMTTAAMQTVKCPTTRFGEIEVDEDLVISMPGGLIGFEDCRRFVVVNENDKNPFRWFQSLDNGSVAFPIIDPWDFKPDYAPSISDADAAQLGIDSESPKLIFAVVTIPRQDPRRVTANLLGPIVINPVTRNGKQVIVADEHYGAKHSIMDEMNRKAAA